MTADFSKLARECWSDLCEKDDRTSPEDYPDHALITKEELAGYIMRAASALDRQPMDEAGLRRFGATNVRKAEIMPIYEEIALAAMRRVSVSAPSQVVPDGWQLVPKEPTEDMLRASWHHTAKATAAERMACELGDSYMAHMHKMTRRYRAMLVAAPLPRAPSETDIEHEAGNGMGMR